MKNKVKVYFINLDSEVAKNKHMTELCNLKGFNFERIPAILGKTITDDEIECVYDKNATLNNLGRNMTRGEIGCVKSHLLALGNLVTSEYEYALIFEDDIDFELTVKQIDELIDCGPIDFDVILLGHHPRYIRTKGAGLSFWNRVKVTKYHIIGKFSEKPLGAYSYLVTKKAALTLLRDFDTIKRPFDWWNFDELNIYGIYPPISKIAEQFTYESTLNTERKNVEFKRSFYQKIKDKVRITMVRLNIIETYFLLNRTLKKIYKSL
ncbi:hypothetical protein AT00_17145 [Pseudoalteromonas lipolytica SCSIO 04301]|uniref:glycosyltransferase family 25 protein n=1 Tax=Pseudoalteromonas lipolytica TaxID=570156 RepID=UPI00044AB1BB|nr:glycosyltransferase family 25 protein [Pseudoalteromonas lipolytica]EWH04888.1 hypothetical protein AT00_17145 [Pseudoalteromonas lipolytica SCSIO 04301]